MTTRKNPGFGRLCKSAIFTAAIMSAAILGNAQAHEGAWKNVFNGKDLTGLKQHGDGTVKVVDGVIDVQGGGGYLYTEKDYSHYRVKAQWKNLGGGNTGYLYHIDLGKHACGAWPAGLEMQLMQGDVGSIYTTDSKFDSTGSGDTFSESGGAITGIGEYGCGRQHFIRAIDKEIIGGWNTWELYDNGDSMEAKVNGTVVMRISKLTMGDGVPMVKGKMGLQIEGSHVQWRNWKVMELDGS